MFTTPMNSLGSNLIAMVVGAAIVLGAQWYAKVKQSQQPATPKE